MKFSATSVAIAVALFTVCTEATAVNTLARRGNQFVTGPCKKDSDCQQGCCAFKTGKCAGPGIAQTRDGGCGFGNPKPNCNVAKALGLGTCVAGAKNGNIADPQVQAAAKFTANLDGLKFTPAKRGNQFVTGPCKQDSDCQQGCCAFNTGKCAGPGIAQTRDGGCGFGSPAPNCNVAKALGLSECAPGAVNGNLADPAIQEAAKFTANLDGLTFTPAKRGNQFVTGPCKQDSDCQQGCCAFNTGKCAGPGIAQTRDGGCGFGSPAPNCNVAKALGLSECAPGAVNGNLADPAIQEAAKFTANLDGLTFTPQ